MRKYCVCVKYLHVKTMWLTMYVCARTCTSSFVDLASETMSCTPPLDTNAVLNVSPSRLSMLNARAAYKCADGCCILQNDSKTRIPPLCASHMCAYMWMSIYIYFVCTKRCVLCHEQRFQNAHTTASSCESMYAWVYMCIKCMYKLMHV
jgi:hypothetical protein